MSKKIAVIIPTARRPDLLRECLGSLRQQTCQDFETILVSDGAGVWAEELSSQFGCTLVGSGANRGFAAAINRGLAACDAEYAVLLNDDVRLDRDWLRITSTFLDEHREIAFCCGKIRLAGKQVIDNVGDAVSLAGSAWRLGHGRADSEAFDSPRAIFTCSATAAMVRKNIFDEVGGLDENFVAYLEDIDFSLRAARQGHRGFYLPQAASDHWGGATSGGPASPVVFRCLTQNQLLILAQNYPGRLLLRWAARIAWAQVLWAAMAVRKHRTLAYLGGVVRFLRLLPRAIRKRRSWQAADIAAFAARLRASEDEIYSDIFAPDRIDRDAFWQMYFFLFSPRRNQQAAAKRGLGGLPIR